MKSMKKIIFSSVLISILSLIGIYIPLSIIHAFTSPRISNFEWIIIFISFYSVASILLGIKVKIYKKQSKITNIELLSLYLSLFLCHCILGILIIPQPGGINLFCRFLSPIFGPWSRFLPPNALIFSKCTQEYLIFAIAISILSPIFIVLSFSRNKTICRIAIISSFIAVFIWAGYGINRILLDCS
jgi:hypothetical protein